MCVLCVWCWWFCWGSSCFFALLPPFYTALLSSTGETPFVERGTGVCHMDDVSRLGVFRNAIGGILTEYTARVCARSGGGGHTKNGECAQRPQSAARTPGHTKPNQTTPCFPVPFFFLVFSSFVLFFFKERKGGKACAHNRHRHGLHVAVLRCSLWVVLFTSLARCWLPRHRG